RELRRTNVELKHQIAQRLQTEDELIQAGKLAVLGQMSAGISHEINQPLTALRALSRNTQLLLGQGRTNTVADNLKLIDDMVERMASITRQLKTFARKAESANAPISLLGAVRNTMLLLEHRLRIEGVSVNVDVSESLRVHCDANRLEQVLVNLFSNALDAMSSAPQKVLDVSAAPAQPLRTSERSVPPRVLVQVQDSGPGMPEAVRARLFEPFFTTKPAGQGLGLGLVISSKIIHEFGGTLRAHARDDVADDGQPGMVFEFDLEVAADV
ncbi:MAG: ATP-binding protein, partial [Ideonella sp.]|nr:ATP-binding protein [Ideonella sp.]